MAHTPGPWAYDPDSKEVFSSNEGHGCGWIALVKGNDSADQPLPAGMQAANARLIAAAPDLLAACREMAEIIHSMSEGGVGLAAGAAAPYMAVIRRAEGRE